jgi:uncharacterized protein
MKNPSTYPLRLPRSVKAEVERRAKQDGISISQFLATAAAEKLAAMSTAEFFAERRERADMNAFDRLMRLKVASRPSPATRSPEPRERQRSRELSNNVDEIADENAEAIAKLQRHEAELRRLGVEHLYLFGSTARAAAREDCDVDLFFDHPEGSLGLFALMDVKAAAARIIGRKTDIDDAA